MLNSVLEYQVPIADAAELVGVTQRHARRMLAAYRKRGAAALAHGNRGRRPHNATSPGEVAAVVRLATERYEGANHTHITELLSEREGIDLSRPTVRRILTRAASAAPAAGALRSTVFAASGCPRRGCWCSWAAAIMPGWRIEGSGIPLALYSDRHAVFKHNSRHPETAAETTQFTRSLQELGIRQIFARSPQAKGRVERAAGTFQDRLVTELPLAGARTMDQATAVLQEFLPRYNARFAVQPDRPVDPGLTLSEILCFKDTRKVGRDNTVKYN